MSGKGCGCLGLTLAVLGGLALGVAGLGVVGYSWVNNTVLESQPVGMPLENWSKVEEAALAAKMSPILLSMKTGNEGVYAVSLKEREMNRLLDEYVLINGGGTSAQVSFGDTAMEIGFSIPVRAEKYLNGAMRADIKAKDGDFAVKVLGLKTGGFVWPGSLLPQVSHWLEGVLETQTPFRANPWRVIDWSVDDKKAKLKLRTVNPADLPAEP